MPRAVRVDERAAPLGLAPLRGFPAGLSVLPHTLVRRVGSKGQQRERKTVQGDREQQGRHDLDDGRRKPEGGREQASGSFRLAQTGARCWPPRDVPARDRPRPARPDPRSCSPPTGFLEDGGLGTRERRAGGFKPHRRGPSRGVDGGGRALSRRRPTEEDGGRQYLESSAVPLRWTHSARTAHELAHVGEGSLRRLLHRKVADARVNAQDRALDAFMEDRRIRHRA